jgi:3-phenylpropionate/trans-cinnamate dioxygenase ferredoxin reductase component
MTADAAVRGIRELDQTGNIGIIGNENHPPYNRPPLSKGLWKGKPLDRIWRRTQDFSVDLILARTVISIDTNGKVIQDDHGKEYQYEKLLLATGGAPRKLPFSLEDIIYYRTLDDYNHLRDQCEQGQHFAVIGGGFIGSEISAALSMIGKKVTMFFPEPGIGARVFPDVISDYLTSYYHQKGVETISGVNVTNIKKTGFGYTISTDQGKEVQVDGVVAGIGIQPNRQLARLAGLEIGNGIVVNETLNASHPDIFAAGDVAEFFNPILGKRVRLEHEDCANTMGKQAGRNMAGAKEPYNYFPYFYSDLFEIGYEAIGELDSRMDTYVDWKEPLKNGVVYYLAEGRVRGVLLLNVRNTIPAARNLIAEPGPFYAADLKGRL